MSTQSSIPKELDAAFDLALTQNMEQNKTATLGMVVLRDDI